MAWLRYGWALLASLTLLGLGLSGARIALARAAYKEVRLHPNLANARALQLLRRACRLRPDWSPAWRLQAQWLEFRHPHQALRLALRATRYNPDNWRNWHLLGVLEYQLNHPRRALADLRESVHWNSGFMANYQAANLSFLLGQRPAFWEEMAKALRMAPARDVISVLRNIHHLEGNHPAQWLGLVPPRRVRLNAQSIRYLASTGDLASATSLWERLACPSYRRKVCQAAALSLAQAWLQQARQPLLSSTSSARAGRQARRVWNQAIQRNILSAHRVTPGRITDSRFLFPWVGILSWRAGSSIMVQFRRRPGGQADRISLRFHGNELSHLVLAEQWLYLRPHHLCRLRFQIRGTSLRHRLGLSLNLYSPAGKLLASAPGRPARTWQTAGVQFQTPLTASLARLEFRYDRPYGEALLRGRVELANPRLQDVSPAPLALTTVRTARRSQRP